MLSKGSLSRITSNVFIDYKYLESNKKIRK